MNQKNNGGPAFPVLNDGHHMLANMDAGQRLAEGMSLRDYFAAKALPGVITAIMSSECHNWKAADFATEAYELADAMLAERAK